MLPATLERMVSQAQDLIAARHAPSTRVAYASDWRQFCAWATKHGVQSLPASVDAVVLFLSDLAGQGIKSTSIVRKASAIKFAHRDAGFASPTDMEAVRATLSGIRRTLGTKPRQVPLDWNLSCFCAEYSLFFNKFYRSQLGSDRKRNNIRRFVPSLF